MTKPNFGQDVEQQELSFTAGGNATWCSHLKNNNFIYDKTQLCQVFVAAQASLLVVSRVYSSLTCVDFSSRWFLLLRRVGSRARRACSLQELQHTASVVVAPGLQGTGSVVVTYRLSCSMACGIFQDQGLNPCLLHQQADSLPLSHQGTLGKATLCDSLVASCETYSLHKIQQSCFLIFSQVN